MSLFGVFLVSVFPEIHRAGRIDAMKVRKVSTGLYHDDSCHTLAKRHTVSECRLVGWKYSIPYVIQVFPKVSINGEWLAKIKQKKKENIKRHAHTNFFVRGILMENHFANVSAFSNILKKCKLVFCRFFDIRGRNPTILV